MSNLKEQVIKQQEDLAKTLSEYMPAEEAKKQAADTIAKQGITKIASGECPLGAVNPMACTFCSFGHMTECHYPYTCEEVECSHYQAEMEAEGYGDSPDTWDDFRRDLEQ